MRLRYKTLVLLFISTLALSACVREYFQASKVQLGDWPQELGIPIINTQISTARLIDRLDDGELQVPIDADGRVSLWQTGQLFSILANDIVSFPDTGNSLTIPGLIVLASPVRTTEQYAFNAPNGMKVEHLDLRSGEAYLRLSSAFSKPGNVRVEIPALSNGVRSYDETLAFDTISGGVLSISEKVVDISGYSFDFTQATPAYNRFNYDITLSMDNALPGFSDSLILEFGYRNLSFTFMDGDFGQQLVSLDEDSIFLPLFDAFGEGSVLFNDLEFEFEIINSFGFPVDVNFLKLEALDVGSSSPTAWDPNGTSGSFPQPFSLDFPAYGDFGASATTILNMNRGNSNINELIGDKPKWLYHQIEAISNADSNTTLDFMTDTSGFTVNSTMKIPLSGRVQNLGLTDTAEFMFSYDLSKVNRLEMNFGAENSFPMGANVTITLHDFDFSKSMVLLDGFEVEAGTNDIPFSNLANPFVISLDSEELLELPLYSHAIVQVTLDTDGDVVVKDHLFTLRAGANLISK